MLITGVKCITKIDNKRIDFIFFTTIFSNILFCASLVKLIGNHAVRNNADSKKRHKNENYSINYSNFVNPHDSQAQESRGTYPESGHESTIYDDSGRIRILQSRNPTSTFGKEREYFHPLIPKGVLGIPSFRKKSDPNNFAANK